MQFQPVQGIKNGFSIKVTFNENYMTPIMKSFGDTILYVEDDNIRTVWIYNLNEVR